VLQSGKATSICPQDEASICSCEKYNSGS
jgi:hypothetical protein